MNKVIDAEVISEVISEVLDGQSLKLELKVPKELHYLDGHFPNHPIVPGVVQIQWIIDHASRHFSISGKMQNMKQVKFHELWQPETTAEATISWDSDKKRLKFSLQSDAGKLSSGILIFE